MTRHTTPHYSITYDKVYPDNPADGDADERGFIASGEYEIPIPDGLHGDAFVAWRDEQGVDTEITPADDGDDDPLALERTAVGIVLRYYCTETYSAPSFYEEGEDIDFRTGISTRKAVHLDGFDGESMAVIVSLVNATRKHRHFNYTQHDTDVSVSCWEKRMCNKHMIRIDIDITPDDDGPEGQFASGDDEQDAEVCRQINTRLDQGDLWAWCCVEVKVTCLITGESESDYLSGCSYTDEDDYKIGGYFPDMVEEALGRLQSARLHYLSCSTQLQAHVDATFGQPKED